MESCVQSLVETNLNLKNNILVVKKMRLTVPRQSLAKVSELLEVYGESGPVLVPKARYHQYRTKDAQEHYFDCQLVLFTATI